MSFDLAIVIPAYKGEFLARTLASIKAQTDRRFRIYVGDDASPNAIKSITQASGLNAEQLVYHRFETNLGRESLVKHWDRCIQMSQEPWVWLFSDDDTMDSGCVAAFYSAIEQSRAYFDLYRFNTVLIDRDDKPIALNPPHPEFELWNQLVYFLLRRMRLANQQEVIFRRASYLEIGGFLDLPLAWGSDHAFAIACGTRKGIYTMQKPWVYFRQSGVNFSSRRQPQTDWLKLLATAEFVAWLLDYIQKHECATFPERTILEPLARERFFSSLQDFHRSVSLRALKELLPFLRERLGIPGSGVLCRMLHYKACAASEKLRRFCTR